jgi:hypothetical protein
VGLLTKIFMKFRIKLKALIIISLTFCLNSSYAAQAGSQKAAGNPAGYYVSYVKFTAVRSHGRSTLNKLKKKYGDQGLFQIVSLNRVDLRHASRLDSLAIPDSVGNFLHCSPFPRKISRLDSIPKIVMVSRRQQAFAAFEHGRLVKWGPVSTGRKEKPTPAGLFSANFKMPVKHSTFDDSWVMPFYFNIDTKEGIALHQFDLPGYPASHGCVRLLKEDAVWFYSWGEQWLWRKDTLKAHGTPVIIFDEFPYGKRKPWRAMLKNSQSYKVGANEIDSILDKYLDTIKDRDKKRKEYLEYRKSISKINSSTNNDKRQ